jgi:PPK2 family polyphosphate:nucleotide phosphotransferase
MARTDAALKNLRVGAKLRLRGIDPAANPFSSGDKATDLARLDELATEIDRLQDLLYANGQASGTAHSAHKLLLVLQGLDTSGKDGTARAVFNRTSPLGVRVAAFKAPSETEQAHDFLWRVHQVVPRAGEIAVFNRSHMEDVLVPFVEGWIDAAERKRRFAHINDFERLLCDTGTVVVKCYLHISKEEQRLRLQARLDDPAKQWKFQPGDLQTRAKWKHYEAAYESALAATSTAWAPWHVVPADSKTHRNLVIAELVVAALRGMKLEPPKPGFDPKAVVIA